MHDPVFSIRLDAQTRALLDRLSRAQGGVSLGSLVRTAIREHAARELAAREAAAGVAKPKRAAAAR